MNTPININLEKLLLDKGINLSVQPTIAEVVSTLYRKHNIWITVFAETYSDGINFLWQVIYLTSAGKNSMAFGDNGEYKTPEEAYEAAIEYVLEQI